MLWCDHSNEPLQAVLFHDSICFSMSFLQKKKKKEREGGEGEGERETEGGGGGGGGERKNSNTLMPFIFSEYSVRENKSRAKFKAFG